jgi:hypothetical protein
MINNRMVAIEAGKMIAKHYADQLPQDATIEEIDAFVKANWETIKGEIAKLYGLAMKELSK